LCEIKSSFLVLGAQEEAKRKKDCEEFGNIMKDELRKECPDYMTRRSETDYLNNHLSDRHKKIINLEFLQCPHDDGDDAYYALELLGWECGEKDPGDREIIDELMTERDSRLNDELEEFLYFDENRDIYRDTYGYDQAEGGFSSVYNAIWSGGIRKIEIGDDFIRARSEPYTVALKTFKDENNSLVEIENHLECRFVGSGLKIYGITRNTLANGRFKKTTLKIIDGLRPDCAPRTPKYYKKLVYVQTRILRKDPVL
ncbi:4918_t:CDS:2, partial [Racocetra fulgida]